MKIALLVNPLAGIGGSVALKGSDGEAIVEAALARGAKCLAGERAYQALSSAADIGDCELYTVAGPMGRDVLDRLGVQSHIVYRSDTDGVHGRTTADDTRAAVAAFIGHGVDLIVFAGGDGTARDVLDVLVAGGGQDIPVIGIPAGVKIHSAVYAVTPKDAGDMLQLLITGAPMSLHEAEVMDLDEDAFRDGRVVAKCYGYLKVPVDDMRMQVTKEGGINHEQIALQDIAEELAGSMQDSSYYLVGSGSTTAVLMEQLGLENTLLGIDIVRHGELVASDVSEQQILDVIGHDPAKLIITVIGGQGHVFGRGNQQLSPAVIRRVGRNNIIIVATNEKLRSLQGRPMIADTGDADLDRQLAGLYQVVTGYQQHVLYRLNIHPGDISGNQASNEET